MDDTLNRTRFQCGKSELCSTKREESILIIQRVAVSEYNKKGDWGSCLESVINSMLEQTESGNYYYYYTIIYYYYYYTI